MRLDVRTLEKQIFQPKKILEGRKILIPAKLSNKFCMEAKFNLFSPNRVTCFFALEIGDGDGVDVVVVGSVAV